MTEVNIADIQKKINEIKVKKTPKKKLHPVNNPPRKVIQEEQQINNISSNNSYFEGTVPQELSAGLKSLCLLGLSMPIQKHKQKRLLCNLRDSKYIDNYLNKYLTIDMISNLDDHTKFIMCYGMNYLDAFCLNDTTGTLHENKKNNNIPIPENNI